MFYAKEMLFVSKQHRATGFEITCIQAIVGNSDIETDN